MSYLTLPRMVSSHVLSTKHCFTELILSSFFYHQLFVRNHVQVCSHFSLINFVLFWKHFCKLDLCWVLLDRCCKFSLFIFYISPNSPVWQMCFLPAHSENLQHLREHDVLSVSFIFALLAQWNWLIMVAVFVNRSFSSTTQRVMDPDPLLMRRTRWTCLKKVHTVCSQACSHIQVPVSKNE